MKSVLISIQPKWCELIASGKKTVEVRKTRPRLETPFKCYIYETQGKRGRLSSFFWDYEGTSKVIGEFICNEITVAEYGSYCVLPMKKLAAAGSVHAKYRRMIIVTVDITAPLYWWKEFDTYKVGTVANSCSTMHKIHAKEFVREDFSHEHLLGDNMGVLDYVIHILNYNRKIYLETKDKVYWWQMIQLLPSSYNQRRTVLLNYEVLAGIYRDRKEHKLDEWRELCKWIEELPYSEIITLKKENKSND